MKLTFEEKLRRPQQSDDQSWAFVVLPREISETLPRRGRISVNVVMNGYGFVATLQPDGQLSHWLRVEHELVDCCKAVIGKSVTVEIATFEEEPEPTVPIDLQNALLQTPLAMDIWQQTTTIARVDWIHWIESAKQVKTRVKRIQDACNMLASGKKRVCCFDTSGFYSKAFSAPQEA